MCKLINWGKGIKNKMDNTVIVLVLYLIVCALMDIKEKKIPAGVLYIGLIVATVNFLVLLFCRERTIPDMILPILPGLSLVVFSKLSKGLMGEADGVILIIAGLFLTLLQTVLVLSFSFFFAFLAACILLFINKAGKKSQLPFIPFICISTILVRYVI